MPCPLSVSKSVKKMTGSVVEGAVLRDAKRLPINKCVILGNKMTSPARRDDESYWRYGEEEERSWDVKIVA